MSVDKWSFPRQNQIKKVGYRKQCDNWKYDFGKCQGIHLSWSVNKYENQYKTRNLLEKQIRWQVNRMYSTVFKSIWRKEFLTNVCFLFCLYRDMENLLKEIKVSCWKRHRKILYSILQEKSESGRWHSINSYRSRWRYVVPTLKCQWAGILPKESLVGGLG